MDRRNFLAGASATPFGLNGAFDSLRSTAPSTLNELVHSIEQMYECVDGPPKAYFEGANRLGELGRGVYVVLSNGILKSEGESSPDIYYEAEAISALWASFLGYSAGKTGRLYWRGRPEVEGISPEDQLLSKSFGHIETSPGIYHNREIVEDNLVGEFKGKTLEDFGCSRTKHYARMRLVITDIVPWVEQNYNGTTKIDNSGVVWERLGRIK